MSQIADTILKQIVAIDPTALFAWGVRQTYVGESSLTLKTTGMVKWKGYVEITLNGNDLYNIRYFCIRKSNIVEVLTQSDVFVEDLVRMIDSIVG